MADIMQDSLKSVVSGNQAKLKLTRVRNILSVEAFVSTQNIE